MLSTGAKKAVDQASPMHPISLIVWVHMDDALSEIARIEDAGSRASMLDTVYEKAKRPWLNDFLEYRHAGMRIVDALEGTPQFIVTGPAKAWRSMITNGSAVVSAPNVELLANEPHWGIGPDVTVLGAA